MIRWWMFVSFSDWFVLGGIWEAQPLCQWVGERSGRSPGTCSNSPAGCPALLAGETTAQWAHKT